MTEIIQGSDQVVEIKLIRVTDSDPKGSPIDISSPDKLEACFKNQDGSNLIKTGSVVNGPGGIFTATLTEVETALLKKGLSQHIEVELEKPTGITTIIQILKAIDVIERLCS